MAARIALLSTRFRGGSAPGLTGYTPGACHDCGRPACLRIYTPPVRGPASDADKFIAVGYPPCRPADDALTKTARSSDTAQPSLARVRLRGLPSACSAQPSASHCAAT